MKQYIAENKEINGYVVNKELSYEEKCDKYLKNDEKKVLY